MISTGYILGGFALYTVVTHVACFAAIGNLKRRIDRLEEVFRQMGVTFGEDTPSADISDREEPPK